MRRTIFKGRLAALAFATLLGSVLDAAAGAPVVHVAPKSGADSGACAITAPCKTLTYALSQVNAGGQALIVEPGQLAEPGTINIAQGVTIRGVAERNQLMAPASGPIFSVSITDPNATSFLLGNLALSGPGSSSPGILFTKGAVLRLVNVSMGGFLTGEGYAIKFTPSAGSLLQLIDSHMFAVSSAFVYAVSSAGVGMQVVNSTFTSSSTNGFTIIANQGPAALTFDGSEISYAKGRAINISANGTPCCGTVSINHSTIRNAGYAVSATGSKANVFLNNATLNFNGAGVIAASGGKIYSLGNNAIAANQTNVSPGTTISPVGQQ